MARGCSWRTSRHASGGAGHARGSAAGSAPPAADGAADRDPRARICGSRSTRRGSCCLRPGSGFRIRAWRLLQERTEGWVAGLRLAAISLAQHPDPERFVREFSGSERTVAGYLLAEVLDRQPAEVRDLLLRTSVLERVSGPLADFLTGGSGSERILQQLEDANAFVSSLDAGRTWFRYHHLFADLLQLELRRAAPASRWLACTGRRPGGTSRSSISSRPRGMRRRRTTGRSLAPARRQLLRSGPRRPHRDGSRPAGRVSRRCGGRRRGAGAGLRRRAPLDWASGRRAARM